MKKDNGFSNLFQGVMLGHLILLLHLLLLAAAGLIIVFFRVIIAYMPLFLIAGVILFCAAAYFLYKRMRHQGRHLGTIFNKPSLSGKKIEIRLLGGLASIKINPPGDEDQIGIAPPPAPAALVTDKKHARIIELPELSEFPNNNTVNRAAHSGHGRKLFNWKN